ncbi:cold shock domain-containing protein [uncultured Vibrio sp.]|uniref:cold-shock protein n=1 Tax=uncultured Vibrio sp. TaxID=114054 RepID=UPI0009206860|nr:cold shock domain-containing protein [uncultured Vibrio sp.]OIQ26411.1 MAG: hypothetical protein BM561_01215 [Vibrio sp. MedPE-SWchi]
MKNILYSKGRVVWYNADKGFGFALTDHGSNNVLLHNSAIDIDGDTILFTGQRVYLEIEDRGEQLGLQATKIIPLCTLGNADGALS